MPIALAWNAQPTPPRGVQPQALPFAVAVSRLVEGADGAALDFNEGPPVETKILAVGDGEFLQDSRVQQPTITLLFNAAQWMLDDSEWIAVEPRMPENTPVADDLLTMRFKLRMTLAFCVMIVPSLIFFGGVGLASWRRKSE